MPGPRAKKRYCDEWQAYVDDLTVRAGRVVDGVLYTDAQVTAKSEKLLEMLALFALASPQKKPSQPWDSRQSFQDLRRR